jgi:hypothetical protein
MNQYLIAIVVALIMQAVTLIILWITHKDRQGWVAMWTRDNAKNLSDRCELLYWKHHAVLRDPKTGKYVKKDKS